LIGLAPSSLPRPFARRSLIDLLADVAELWIMSREIETISRRC
jgi:hypothetical protein